MSHKLFSLFIGEGEYYTRIDVDNVIAEKDTEIDGLKERIEVLNHQVCKMNCAMVKHYNEVCDDLIHHKYKRCLAMAEKCHALYDKYSMLAADDANWEEEDYYFARWRFFEKWKYKWLELAEKFKEAK